MSLAAGVQANRIKIIDDKTNECNVTFLIAFPTSSHINRMSYYFDFLEKILQDFNVGMFQDIILA